MRAAEAISALGGYTAGQWGLVTAAQARQVGVGSVMLLRLTEQNLLVKVRRGVYAVTAGEETQHSDIKAAWLGLHPSAPGWDRGMLDPDGGVVSHRSAALLHGLGDMVADRIEFTVPRRRGLRDATIRPRHRRLGEDEVTLIEGLPTTTIERTVLDLLDDHVDASHVGSIIGQAEQDGRLDLEPLAPRAAAYSRRYGLPDGTGRELLDHLLAQSGHQSPAEQVLTQFLNAYPEVTADLRRALGPQSTRRNPELIHQTPPDLTLVNIAPVRRAIQRASTPHHGQLLRRIQHVDNQWDEQDRG